MNACLEFQTSGNQWQPTMGPVRLEEISSVPGGAFLPGLFDGKPRQGGTTFGDPDRQMALYAAEHEAVLRNLRREFVIPVDSSVTAFLADHRAVPPMLLEAMPHLRTCFGTDTIVNLRAPIDESGSRTLYAVVMWPGAAQDVRAALQRFDNEWWLRRAGQAAGFLTFTYELV